MLSSAIPTKFPIVWGASAASGDLLPVPTTPISSILPSLQTGWAHANLLPLGAGGTPPDGRYDNGILNQITAWNQWQQVGGAIPWDSAFSSAIGGYPCYAVVGSGTTPGTYWQSTSENNVTDPDTGGAGWIAWPPQLASGLIPGAYSNKVSVTLSNTTRKITAAFFNVAGGGNATQLTNVSVTISSGTVGANGLDTGTLAANQQYYEHIIYNPTGPTVAGLMSLSATAPTLPSGYTQFALSDGAAITGTSKNFYRITQSGSDAQYVVTPATNTAELIQLAVGPAGNLATPTWVAISLVNLVPATAVRVRGVLVQIPGGGGAAVVPNSNYGAVNSFTNPPPILTVGAPGGFGVGEVLSFDYLLESNSIYWAGSSDEAVYIFGWKDPQ